MGDERSLTGRGKRMPLVTRHASRVTGVASSCIALVITFFGLSQFDFPIVRYVRSVTTHLPWNHLTVPWMAFTSDAGDWIGEGSHLVALSVVLLVIGWMFSKTAIRTAAIDTLLAHGLAALVANILKHLIGRPRPKFVHSGEWQFTPSFASGLDSFPSGHSAASFAVATVLAKRFPAFGPLCLGVAAFVALSRVLRGSHFPTDVLGGAVFGVLSGSIAAGPLKQWRVSLQEGLKQAAMGSCAALALLWSLSQPAESGVVGLSLIGLGLAAMVGGLWLRRAEWVAERKAGSIRAEKLSPVLIAYGLASMTTSLYVVAAAGFACLAYWFNGALVPEEERPGSWTWPVIRESVLLGGVLLALLILYDGRGILPFR